MGKLVAVSEVARASGLSPEVVRRLFNRGALPGKLLAGRILLEEGRALTVAREYAQEGKRGRRTAA